MKRIYTISKQLLLIGAITLFATACAKSSDDSGGSSAATASVLTISPNPAYVSSGQTVMLSVSGGSGSYTYNLSTSIGGTLSNTSGNSTVFTPGTTSGTVQVNVTDTSGNTGYATVFVTGTGGGTGALTISPLNTTLAASGATTFTVTGGTAPYYFTVTSGGGYFSAASSTTGSVVYYAPSTAQTVTVQISDSAGNSTTTSVYVSGTSTTASACGGTFNMNLAGTAATLQVIEDASGNVGGYISISGSYAPISGTCSAGTISFTNLYSGSPYTGSYFVNPSTNTLVMTGTFSYAGSSYSWFATQ